MLQDENGRHILYTCYEHENYNSSMMEDAGVVTSEGVDTVTLIGRERGECSILLPTKTLAKFDRIRISDKLYKATYRQSSLVVYPCGNQTFYCGVGKFMFDELSWK